MRTVTSKIFLSFICLTLILFTAFISKQQNPLYQQFIGEWRNIYIKISMPPATTAGTPRIMEADSTNWEARLKIHPIRTHFNADGSYYSEYINLKDSITRRPTGT
ncbi:MAG: hypothetical protein ABIN91_06435 [Mucilaginibacter sp.]|uniref:hypothetical protein n=1 Tax=Mucilaginibacter sp. TaxID=1882438 RepID=UPI003266CCD2